MWQRLLNLGDTFLNSTGNFSGILTNQHHDQTGHCFASGITCDGPLTGHWFDRNICDIPDKKWRAIGLATNHNFFEVIDISDESLTSEKSLFIVMNDVPAASGCVVGFNRGKDLSERQRIA